jgi:hypothetical protein
MAQKTSDAFEFARQTADHMTERSQEAIANYFSWLQNAMQAKNTGRIRYRSTLRNSAKPILIFVKTARSLGSLYSLWMRVGGGRS